MQSKAKGSEEKQREANFRERNVGNVMTYS